jgi:ABC-2 type transport system ATP-binding protein
MANSVEVHHLTKVFRVPVREPGLKASLKAVFKREHRDVLAVDDVSFALEPGEIVRFLGPNGEGKTTTLKMLSGLLHPTEGRGEVLGHTPQRRERAFLQRSSLVMGNRNSLQWDLPAADSFELHQAMYGVSDADFTHRRDHAVELLEAGDLITKPVRNLSFGERMKMEIIASLLHGPDVFFLDEPTIGLDVTMQKRIRQYIADYAAANDATVMLTSHYMADVVAMCERVIVIHKGRILYDGDLVGLAASFVSHQTVTVSARESLTDPSRYGTVISHDPSRTSLEIPRGDTAGVVARLLADFDVTALSIEDPPIEDVIEQVFAVHAEIVDPVVEST